MSKNTSTDILLAGAVAAFSVDLLIYPLDTIKTRVQSTKYRQLYTNAHGSIQRSLFRGLYQGIGSVVLATVPSSGAFFMTYEGTKSVLQRLNGVSGKPGSQYLPTPVIHAMASSTAELVSCLILTPAEVLKQNAQMVRKSASTQLFDTTATAQAFRRFSKPSQLFRGYTALAGRNLPFTAMQFPLFEYLKKQIIDYRDRKKLSRGSLLERGLITATAAGSAGSLAAVLTTPIDVVKTRIMLSAASEDGRDPATIKQPPERVSNHGKISAKEQAQRAARSGRGSPLAVGREILRSEGFKALFRGGALRGSWTALGSGLYLGVYETGRSYLEARRR